MYENRAVTGREVLRKLNKLARARQVAADLLHKMCRDLGIKPADL